MTAGRVTLDTASDRTMTTMTATANPTMTRRFDRDIPVRPRS
jgi:hypothetical protein